MKKELAHLTVAAVEAIHVEVLSAHGGGAGIRDRGLLEAAVMAPQATSGGEPLLQEPVEIAAAYLFYLCSNHPFVDGNKRTALAACLVFLDSNGILRNPNATAENADAWEALVLDVAAGRLERVETTQRLRALLEAAERD
jgi:death-on-curing protein